MHAYDSCLAHSTSCAAIAILRGTVTGLAALRSSEDSANDISSLPRSAFRNNGTCIKQGGGECMLETQRGARALSKTPESRCILLWAFAIDFSALFPDQRSAALNAA